MKKRISFLTLAFFVLIVLSCSLFKPSQPTYQKWYLPEQFGDLYLGMPYEEFVKTKDVSQMEKSEMFSFRFEHIETPEDENIKEVTYYFEDENLPENPLYELIIEYEPSFDLAGYIKEKYGPPNYEGEWRFEGKEEFPIMVWTFDQKLVIAGKMKGTEWE
jgi:hypothetical protein